MISYQMYAEFIAGLVNETHFSKMALVVPHLSTKLVDQGLASEIRQAHGPSPQWHCFCVSMVKEPL